MLSTYRLHRPEEQVKSDGMAGMETGPCKGTIINVYGRTQGGLTAREEVTDALIGHRWLLNWVLKNGRRFPGKEVRQKYPRNRWEMALGERWGSEVLQEVREVGGSG